MQPVENIEARKDLESFLTKSASEKWGSAADGGYQVVPHALFRFQAELGLSNAELVTLLNILDFWWDVQKNPFPSAATLAKRMNTHPRSVQRHLKVLHDKGFAVRKHEDDGKGVAEGQWRFSLDGLVHRLGMLVSEESAVKFKSQRKEFRSAVSSN